MKQKPLGRVPLERAFSKLGLASRTQARQWIMEGRVRVGGKIIRDPLFSVIPESVRLQVDETTLGRKSWRTIMLHKPRGLITTRSDEKARPTVFSLLTDEDSYLHPVGRLDMATSGLLFLTNDTKLSNWLTDPKSGLIRVYLVTVSGRVTEDEIGILRRGVQDQGELLKPQKVILRKASGRESHLTIELTEGKNREIRRMFEALGHEITALKRVAFGGLALGVLAPGCYREISKAELKMVLPSVLFKE